MCAPRQVKAILVNIFGGIMRCDVIASGIVNAAKQASKSTGLGRRQLRQLRPEAAAKPAARSPPRADTPLHPSASLCPHQHLPSPPAPSHPSPPLPRPQVGVQVPLIVRLEGTNVERGKEILASSGLDLITASDLDDAAHKVGWAAVMGPGSSAEVYTGGRGGCCCRCCRGPASRQSCSAHSAGPAGPASAAAQAVQSILPECDDDTQRKG